jgi:hypothetical protein
MVEALTCTKDWEATEKWIHEQVEDKELEAAFAEMFLDVHSDPADD